jgi:hypothetical protein
LYDTNGSVVQLDRMTDSGSVGWRFESSRGHHTGRGAKIAPLFIFTFAKLHVKSSTEQNQFIPSFRSHLLIKKYEVFSQYRTENILFNTKWRIIKEMA